MKKLITLTLFVAMSFSLSACGAKNNNASSTEQKATQEVTQEAKASFGGLKTIPQFKVNDINDKVVTNDIFTDKKITMINIWGTFCAPCIEEMPHLQEIYKEYEGKGVNIVGVVADGENEVKALEIIKKTKVEFANLIPDEKFKKEFVSKTNAVPVSILVNSKGDIVETVVGSRSKEEYKKIIENNLQQVK